ncbi:MAG TPA: hypothetical protein VGC71_15465 [Gaiellales bacterium]
MRHLGGLAALGALAVTTAAAQAAGAAGAVHRLSPRHVGHAHVLPARSLGPRTFAVSGAGKLQYHGGPVMTGPTSSIAIFWRPKQLQSGAAATVSTGYDAALKRYLSDVGGKGLYGAVAQYGGIRNGSQLLAAYKDTSPYPATRCPAAFAKTAQRTNCLTDAQIQAEIGKVMAAHGLKGGLRQIYFVFLSRGEYTCVDRTACFLYPVDSGGHPLGYCAYHSYFTRGTHNVVYADMPYGDIPFSSKAGSTSSLCTADTSFPNDRSSDIEASITSHEQLEAVTDPLLSAWWDSAGLEIGDKCAYDMTGSTLDGGRANEGWNGHFYSLQTEYDNATATCVPGGSFAPSVRAVARGDSLTVDGANFTPGTTLTVTLKDSAGHTTALGTVPVDGLGAFTGSVLTIPAGAAAGAATIALAGAHGWDGSSETISVT